MKRDPFSSFLIFGILVSSSLFPFAKVSAQVADILVSENWAGYTSEGGGVYDAIGATWTVPFSNGPASSGEATWIGLGGFGRQDLIQAGTLTLIDTQGIPQYYAWYELLPQNPVALSLQVRPGDSVSASIVPLSTDTDQWLIYFRNNTTGKTYQNIVTYASSRTSAEWIEEVPTRTSSGEYLHLSNFGSVNFTNAWVVKGGVTRTLLQANSSKMYLLDFDTDTAYAAPGDLSTNGSAFTVTRTTLDTLPHAVPPDSIGRWRHVGR